MKYQIINKSHRGKAFKVPGGMEVVKAGDKAVLDLERKLDDMTIDRFKAEGVLIKATGSTKQVKTDD